MHPILLFNFFLRVRAAPERQQRVAAVRSLSPLRESNKTLSGARNVKSRQFLPLHFSYTYTQPNRGADTHPNPPEKKLLQVVPKKGVKILKRARIQTASEKKIILQISAIISVKHMFFCPIVSFFSIMF
jgi:hypothetical protein